MSELMKRRRNLIEPEIRYYMIQLINAVGYLHDNRIIHRDLKLGNIFIDKNMCLKIGDFGLATRVAFTGERKRTVCGTPNYIAPEILNNHNGHSYEVDVWSIGIIFYTLMFGRPPYESKDVKMTYKNIVNNQYSFPPSVSESNENIKSLIRAILQTVPESRLSLQQILHHRFFTSSDSYTPATLPTSALRAAPSFINTVNVVQSIPTSASAISSMNLCNDNTTAISSTGGGNENDAGLINRLPLKRMEIKDDLEAKKMPASSSTINGSYKPQLPQRNSRCVSASTTSRKSNGSANDLLNPTTFANPTLTAQVSGTSSSRMGAAPHTYSQQFEVFNDRKLKLGQNTGSSTTSAFEKKEAYPVLQTFDFKKVHPTSNNENVSNNVVVKPICTSPPKRYSAFESQSSTAVAPMKNDIHQINVNMALLHLKNNSSSAPGSNLQRVGDGNALEPDELCHNVEEVIGHVEDYMNQHDESSGHNNSRRLSKGLHTKSTSSLNHVVPDHHNHNEMNMNMNVCETERGTGVKDEMDKQKSNTMSPPKTESAVEAPFFFTPKTVASQIRVTKDLGTIEAMHENLNKTFFVPNSVHVNNNNITVKSQVNVEKQPKVWIVRHVDYTSKYGLGFLLNNGCAGVYFNDSTKIVLNETGDVFQYTERRRKNGIAENFSQCFPLAAYPPELTKKVTLLKHFRNYLMDQNTVTATQGVNNNGDINGFEDNKLLNSNIDAIISNKNVSQTTMDKMSELVYVKKWVKTRHAILFRLSNRTVQVVFFDNSEILLASEANVISYLNKEGSRSFHSLDSIMNSGNKFICMTDFILILKIKIGRTDISKRLKYTQDILQRLIVLQSS